MMMTKVPDTQPTEKAAGLGPAEMRDVMSRRIEEIARERAESRPGADCRPREPIGRRGQEMNHERECQAGRGADERLRLDVTSLVHGDSPEGTRARRSRG